MKKSNKKFILLLFALTIISFNTLSQIQYKVAGNVIDTLKKPIEGVSIRLITDKDTLRSTTDFKGNFSFPKVSHNKFYVVVTALGYKSFASVYELAVKDKNTILETIILKAEPIRLNDIDVNVKVDPIKIKKDTIEYNAGAYTIRENDKVEDLLKQLQGIEVDSKGAVKAMGKKMTKLRVNGEDFFTSNVEDYIRQLPADIIAKLQVIDDYGDEANFTGIKIGEPQKMLNLVTKPGMDNGVFGNADATSATSNAHTINANGNTWRKTKQIGFGANYGITDNAFTKSDNNGFNGSLREKLSKELSINGNYNLSNNSNNSINSNYIETFNPQGTIYDLRESESNAKSFNNRIGFGLNGATKKNFVNASISGSLGINTNNSLSTSNKTGFIQQDLFSNSGVKSNNPNLSGNINWSRKLANNRRSLSVGFNFGTNGSNSNSSINDIIRYYNATTSILVKDSLLNRLVANNTSNANIGGNIQFANSLKKLNDSSGYSFISLSYRFSVSRSKNLQTTRVEDQIGNSFVVDSLGQNYVSNFINQTISLGFNANKKKISYSFGVNFSPSIIIGEYRITGQSLRNYQLNFSPSANLSYQIKDNRNLNFSYNGYTSSPDFNKLQPVRNSNDVQNIIIGNPNLKASSNHSANLTYNQFGLKSGLSIMLGLSGNFSFNSAVSNTVFLRDTLNSLKQQTTYENVNGIYNIGTNYSIDKRLLTNKLSISFDGNVAYSHNVFYTDNILNQSSGINLSNAFRVELNQKKYSFNISTAHSFSSNTYSVLNQNIKNIQILALDGGASWIPTKRFRLNTSVSKSLNFGYNLNSGNPLLVNLGLNTAFLKNNRLNLSVQANDLFNKGSLFRSTITNNSITENRTRFISRYVQATLNYSINQFGKKTSRFTTPNYNESF
ncbi:TonB-dependent receptor [Pedobacter fastidiosus]|uniref:TonB-dependent receptor n=1 Tax=Pedobacter fastidiosus TaxID=2765361 RepID=A0ABR7KN72_9SPHI|nr:TonB-dependent receptor [Pedobacter fastidiosus]MBC6109530.1 TonB-dependent receptor [Pedobacter fastidiosus]